MKLKYIYLFIFLTKVKNLYGLTEIDTAQEVYSLTAQQVTRSHCFKHKFPKLVKRKDIAAKNEMLDRIERLFGQDLTANPKFHHLIDPLIMIKPDTKGSFWKSLEVSDYYLSCLKMYAGFKFFTYEGVLAELEKPNGLERYKFGISRMSSAPHTFDVSKAFWKSIFKLQNDQFESLKSITQIADKFPFFKIWVLPEVFKETFEQSNWDRNYWNKFSLLLSQVEPEIEMSDDLTQIYRVSALLSAASNPKIEGVSNLNVATPNDAKLKWLP